jgi:uncharacterized OB-fold protein
MTEVTPLLPDVSNPVLRPHWEAAGSHRLAIPFCAQCGAPQWPPRPNCLRCHAFEFEWRDVDTHGRLYSYFVAHKPLHPSVADEVPYMAGIIELAAGVKMLGRLVGGGQAEVDIGMPVEARFVERAPGVTLVFWEPVADGASSS